MRVPSWYDLVLLTLAAYRLTRLVGWDVLTRYPRIRWLTHRAETPGDVYVGPGQYRRGVDEFLHCPWCLGFWVTLGVWVAWLAWPHGVVVVAVPLAASCVVGLIGKNLDP